MALLLKLTQKLVLGFQDFWAVWPRKVAKVEAEKAWKKVVTPADHEPIQEALKWQVPMFEAREPEYRPHAATWIRGRRWEDEPPTTTPSRPTVKLAPKTVLPMALQQMEAAQKIRALMSSGMDREEATRIVSLEMGWITDESPPEE